MTTTTFLMLLSAFSVLSGLITEAIKKLLNDKENISYNLVTLITAIIIGSIGTVIYYQLTGIPFTINNIMYAILMGFASGLTSMTSYDKVVQTLAQMGIKNSK